MRVNDPRLAANHFVGMLLWTPMNKAMFTGDGSTSPEELESYSVAAVQALLAGYGPTSRSDPRSANPASRTRQLVRSTNDENGDLYPHEHIQAIANTAAFQIPTVEQGGGSLRAALAQRATDVEVLRLLISMGPIEIMHFQTFSDKAGNAPPLTDPTNGLTFPDLNSGKDPNNGSTGDAVRQMFQTNLIMPEPNRS